jgi:hypothetical protein
MFERLLEGAFLFWNGAKDLAFALMYREYRVVSVEEH